ncbi:MAG TPA: DUF2235 domain-containing protein [Vicinamibacterales bacterium]
MNTDFPNRPPDTLPEKPKNIVICADGTGNTAIKGRGTNVFKMYEAIDQAGHRLHPHDQLRPQVAIYHDGVGTETVKWWRLLTGATGWGLSRNVKQLYAELARVYAPGDKIFLFGFSRGAFTVRTLAMLIHACGILDLSSERCRTNDAFWKTVNEAYREYRRAYNSYLTGLFSRTRPLTRARVAELRKRFSVPIPENEGTSKGKLIQFIGVWDTVDAVGLPFRVSQFVNAFIYAFKFPDRTLNSSVEHACHALALDEERESFAPVLWDESKTEAPHRIEQVWFAGVHSNVGGGYPKHGMSLTALDWMMWKAARFGLRFVPAERLSYRYHGDVDDKMYDSRAGLGVFYRWKPRDVEELCRRNGIVPKVHRSVFERIARNTEGYAPGSIPTEPQVVSSSASSVVTDTIRDLVAKQHGAGEPLLRQHAGVRRVGAWSYWLFVYAVLVTAGMTIVNWYGSVTSGVSGWKAIVWALATNVFTSKWIGLLLQTWWHHPILVAWLAGTFCLALWVDHRLDAAYSEFWHRNGLRLKLRRLMFSQVPCWGDVDPRGDLVGPTWSRRSEV